jgi:hypothetical protein
MILIFFFLLPAIVAWFAVVAALVLAYELAAIVVALVFTALFSYEMAKETRRKMRHRRSIEVERAMLQNR